MAIIFGSINIFRVLSNLALKVIIAMKKALWVSLFMQLLLRLRGLRPNRSCSPKWLQGNPK